MTSLSPSEPSWPGFARQVITAAVGRSSPSAVGPSPLEPRSHSGVFVTLHRVGRLRGCMGTLDDTLPVAEAVRHAAVCAALHDPRFPPVSTGELADLQLEVSILSPPHPMRSLDDLELGRHGIHVRRGPHHGLFLPQVAVEHHMDKETFLSRCCEEKAGLPPDAWRDPDTEVLLFSAAIFHET